MTILCNKCGTEEEFTVRQDSRGLPEAVCKKCGSYIKKLGASEATTYFMAKLEELGSKEEVPKAERMACPYCTENYAIISNNVNVRPRQIEINYCPVCGRKYNPQDRDY